MVQSQQKNCDQLALLLQANNGKLSLCANLIQLLRLKWDQKHKLLPRVQLKLRRLKSGGMPFIFPDFMLSFLGTSTLSNNGFYRKLLGLTKANNISSSPSLLPACFPHARSSCHSFLHQLAFMTGAQQPGHLLVTTYLPTQLIKRSNYDEGKADRGSIKQEQ